MSDEEDQDESVGEELDEECYDDDQDECSECYECGRSLDREEARGLWNGNCGICYWEIRIGNLRGHLPRSLDVREVRGDHQKPCDECGLCNFDYGDYYVYDAASPWGTEKYCLECAEKKFLCDWDAESPWEDLSDSGDDHDSGDNDDHDPDEIGKTAQEKCAEILPEILQISAERAKVKNEATNKRSNVMLVNRSPEPIGAEPSTSDATTTSTMHKRTTSTTTAATDCGSAEGPSEGDVSKNVIAKRRKCGPSNQTRISDFFQPHVK
jgi:hypothetical protein